MYIKLNRCYFFIAEGDIYQIAVILSVLFEEFILSISLVKLVQLKFSTYFNHTCAIW